VGGLLVIFAYVSVLAPNSFFSGTKPLACLTLLLATTSRILSMTTTQLSWTPAQPLKLTALTYDLNQAGTNLILTNSTSIIIILGAILLFTLLAVVKICYFHQGPLRPTTDNYAQTSSKSSSGIKIS